MTSIKFEQTSPRGTATIDTARLLICPDGRAWFCTRAPSEHNLVPATDEQIAALRGHFGPLLSDAVAAVKALA